MDRSRNREATASPPSVRVLASDADRAGRWPAGVPGARADARLDALLAAPVLAMAAAWARDTLQIDAAAAAAWARPGVKRPVVQRAGRARMLRRDLVAAIGAATASGRPISFPGRIRSPQVADAATKADVRALAAVPFRTGGFHGCLIVAKRRS